MRERYSRPMRRSARLSWRGQVCFCSANRRPSTRPRVLRPADAEGAIRRIEIGLWCADRRVHGDLRRHLYRRERPGRGAYDSGQARERLCRRPRLPRCRGAYPDRPQRRREGRAVIYAGVQAGADTVIGHHTLLRSFVTVGEDTQLGHNLTIERAARIGDGVRCSPGSHITSSCVLADRVFLGAGVRTVNDRELIWRETGREPELVHRASTGARRWAPARSSWLASSSVRTLSSAPDRWSPATFRLARPPMGCPPASDQDFQRRDRRGRRVDRPAGRGTARPWRAGPGAAAPLRHGTA